MAGYKVFCVYSQEIQLPVGKSPSEVIFFCSNRNERVSLQICASCKDRAVGVLEHSFSNHRCTPADEFCPVCDGGLAICTVCGGTEGSLTTHCPGTKAPAGYLEEVYNKNMDYQDGQWVALVNNSVVCTMVREAKNNRGFCINERCTSICDEAKKLINSKVPEDPTTNDTQKSEQDMAAKYQETVRHAMSMPWFNRMSKDNQQYYLLLGLTDEAGRVQRLYKNILTGDNKQDINEVMDGLSGVLWHIAALCNMEHIPLEDIITRSISVTLINSVQYATEV